MKDRNAQIFTEIISEIKPQFEGESTGHDWFHIERVFKNALLIAEDEDCDELIVGVGALLHDIADHKFVENADEVAQQKVQKICLKCKMTEEEVRKVQHIVQHVSFKGGVGENKMESIEGLIVQDADRLDAIGAIGIARTFAFGGKFGNEIYNPTIQPASFKSAEEYRNNRTHTINHFYEKLLLLADKMNTKSAQRIAKERHLFMEKFLQQFYAEWEGKQ